MITTKIEMEQRNKFRNNGAIGALLDEYEKALYELIETINDLNTQQLTQIIDFKTKDDDCKSINTILSHIVQSGYTYVIEIRKSLGENIDYRNKTFFLTVQEYKLALIKMYEFNEKLFLDYPNIELCEYNSEKKIKVRWGQNYDIEQLFEHAIVHILRHRRQIEKIISTLNT